MWEFEAIGVMDGGLVGDGPLFGAGVYAAALVAPFVGSFLGLLAVRLPQDKPVVTGRSVCPACNHTLGVVELIPLLGWLIARGRCRHCGARISAFYPLMELAAVGVALWAAVETSGLMLWASCLLGWTLLALAACDARGGLLPNKLTAALALMGLAVSWAVTGGWGGGWEDHLLGLAAGFLTLVLVRWAYRRWRGREGLGLGDAKLLGAVGAWVGWQGLSGLVLLASMAALAPLIGRAILGNSISAIDRIAFGPYLCLAAWLTWLYGPMGFG